MKILNMAVRSAKDGVLQAHIDYANACALTDIDIINVNHVQTPYPYMLPTSQKRYGMVITPPHKRGVWGKVKREFFKRVYLSRAHQRMDYILKAEKPDGIIVHDPKSAKIIADKGYKMVGVGHIPRYLKAYKQHGIDHVFVLTNKMADYAKSLGYRDHQITVIGNTLSTPLKAKLPRKGETLVIGAMARLERKKGMDILLEAFSQLKTLPIKTELLIAGGGKEKNNLEKIIRDKNLDNVHLLGWVKDKQTFFNQIDIFCSPARIEDFGLSFLEAMSSKTPIVATPTDGAVELINNKNNAFLCDDFSVNALYQNLKLACEKSEIGNAYADKAYTLYKEKYSLCSFSRNLHEQCKRIFSGF